MLNRRMLLATIAAASTLLFASLATASERIHYTPASFAEAQNAGRPILVEITAPWCPICRAQKEVLSQLLPAAAGDNLAIFEIDFDTQKDVVRAFGAQMQSTLIAYKGGAEVGRLVGETGIDPIRQLLNATM
jgi:thioredoxin 1